MRKWENNVSKCDNGLSYSFQCNHIFGSSVLTSILWMLSGSWMYGYDDGTIARKLGTESEFGSKFDTIADIVFVVAAAYKMFPVMEIPKGIWIWIGVIALIKIINIISGFVVEKQFVSVHTVANKITGLLVFLLPLTMAVVELRYSALVVCMVATFAAIQEGHIIRIGKVE